MGTWVKGAAVAAAPVVTVPLVARLGLVRVWVIWVMRVTVLAHLLCFLRKPREWERFSRIKMAVAFVFIA